MSKSQTKKRVGILISGRGSNLQSLIDAARAEQYPAEIALVISDKPDAYGLQRAKEAGIETRVIERKDFADKPAFEAAIDDSLRSADLEIVCLAGFMRLLSPWLVDRWLGKLINIHPSLLPSFKGLDAQGQAIRAGVRIAGCTVHFVTAEMDGGPIIQQASVPVLTDDTADSLSDRILTLEHKIYPEALAMLANGGVTLDRNRATFA